MDWNKLSPQQLTEFIQLYKITPQSGNLIEQAQQLFNQVLLQFGNRAVFTEPVIDLYIASNFRGALPPQKYIPEIIRKLSLQQLQQFANVLGLPNITSERLMRILGFLNALDLTSPISGVPSDIDYAIALNLDYLSLINFCKSQVKYSKICNDNNFWVQKIEHDFGPMETGTQTSNIQNGKEEYLKAAIQHGVFIPVPGAEKYTNTEIDKINLMEAAFQTKDQRLINYFASKMRNNVLLRLGLARLAGKYANIEILNSFLSQADKHLDVILVGAAEGGHRNIVQEMIKRGGSEFHYGIKISSKWWISRYN